MDGELVHDLRIPLQLISGCAQLLEQELGQNARARGYVETLLGSVGQMQRMLSGAMERRRPEAGAVRWTRSDVVSRTWEIFSRCRLYADRAGVRMTFFANTDRLEMALDDEKYARILLNLLSNALKFTPRGGGVRLSVRALGDAVETEVADTGCGISPERLENIFQLHETDFGYGCGLTIARDFAAQMGGSLTARSRPGEGSAFTLRLPVRSVEAASAG